MLVHNPGTSASAATQAAVTSVIDCGSARLTAFESSWVTVIAVSGQIDALNAERMNRCLSQFVTGERALILDLSDVDFLSFDGLRALLKLADKCRALGVEWAMVTGQSVRRLLRVGDPQQTLPAVGSMVEVLHRFRTARRRSRQLQALT
jgi:anti-anti-sigma factor